MRLKPMLLATVMFGLALHAHAADAPPLLPDLSTFPNSIGVNIHFTDPRPGELEQIYAGGFRWVRMDFGWGSIERRKSVYDFAAYDRLVAALDAHHIHALFIFDYANRNYDNNRSPHSDEGRAAFAKWAAAAVEHFKGHGILWEMYNEPNGTFWSPRTNVDDYAKLALAVGKAIRESEPTEIYIGPATSTIDLPFLESCFKAGCLEYWSAVSVHPYRQSDPETAAGEYRQVRALIAKYNPKGRPIPIISGEWGYSSVWKNFDDQRQAKYLPRELLTNVANEIPVSIWYDWHEDGKDPKEPEHHFGIVLPDAVNKPAGLYEPKPAYESAKQLASLDGLHFCSRLRVGEKNDYILLFGDGLEKATLACWTTGSPHEVKLATGVNGQETAISLSEMPTYVVPQNAPLLRIAASWSRVPLEVNVAGPAMAKIETTVRNPLDHPITLVSGIRKSILKPGESGSIVAEQPVSRADAPAPIDVVLDVEDMGKLMQRSEAIVTNPLRVIFFPRIGDIQRVRIENPEGGELKAKAMLSGAEPAVVGAMKSLDQGSAYTVTFSLAWKRPADAPVGLLLKDDSGRTLLDLPPVQVSGIKGFDSDHPAEAWHLVVDGDPKTPSEQTLSEADPSDGPPAPGVSCLKLEYRFEKGWKFLRIAPKSEITLPARAKTLGIWVHGDASGNIARLRFVDSSGQTFQPDGGRITWNGWRYLIFPLDARNVAHWGGANDGTVRGAVCIDTLLLLDNYNRGTTQGEIFVSSPTVNY